MLKNSLITKPTEEDPDEGIKDLVEITLKMMVRQRLTSMFMCSPHRLHTSDLMFQSKKGTLLFISFTGP